MSSSTYSYLSCMCRPLYLLYPLLTRTHLQFYTCDTVCKSRFTVPRECAPNSLTKARCSPGQLAPPSGSVEVTVGRDLLDLRKLPLAVAERADRARLQPARDAVQVEDVPAAAPRDAVARVVGEARVCGGGDSGAVGGAWRQCGVLGVAHGSGARRAGAGQACGAGGV